jgi:hypothetical protein
LVLTGTRKQGSGETNNELNDLHSSPNIIRAIKPIRMTEDGYVARMRNRKGAYRVFGGET